MARKNVAISLVFVTVWSKLIHFVKCDDVRREEGGWIEGLFQTNQRCEIVGTVTRKTEKVVSDILFSVTFE